MGLASVLLWGQRMCCYLLPLKVDRHISVSYDRSGISSVWGVTLHTGDPTRALCSFPLPIPRFPSFTEHGQPYWTGGARNKADLSTGVSPWPWCPKDPKPLSLSFFWSLQALFQKCGEYSMLKTETQARGSVQGPETLWKLPPAPSTQLRRRVYFRKPGMILLHPVTICVFQLIFGDEWPLS